MNIQLNTDKSITINMNDYVDDILNNYDLNNNDNNTTTTPAPLNLFDNNNNNNDKSYLSQDLVD